LLLVVLDHEEIVSASVADLLGEVAMAKHGVGGDDASTQDHSPQQVEGGLMFVGLGIDGVLLEDAAGGAVEQG
jgi:hypothetical protein